MTLAVDLAPHEFAANYLFDQYYLSGWFAADSLVKQGGGSVVAEFTDEGETWVTKLYYQDSNIQHPGLTNPQGTPFEIEEMREFRLAIFRHPDEDPVGKQRFNAHLAPRWQGMQVETSKGEVSEYSVPKGITEAINVRVSGANIQFDRYHGLLQDAGRAVDLHPRYVREPHDYSNVQDAERYVRLLKDEAGPVHSRTGPIASMAHLLEDDRDGYRKLVQNERDEHGRHLPGYYHTVTLGPKRIEAAFPSHRLPKEIKHYYAREALSVPNDSPLRHPKLGASYQRSRWDRKLGVDELDELERELDETVLSVLEDAGLSVRVMSSDGGDGSGTFPFVEDAYFTPSNVEQDREIIPLDLTQIRQEQENVVVKYLSENGGLSPVQHEAVHTLLSDGGEVAPKDIAEQNDRHVDSVYRALQAIPELVETAYGKVALKSDYTAELLTQALEDAKDAGERAVRTLGETIKATKRGYRQERRALASYAELHGIDLHDGGAGVVIKMLRDGDTRRRVTQLFNLWTDAGKDPQRLREATIEFDNGAVGTVWQWLR